MLLYSSGSAAILNPDYGAMFTVANAAWPMGVVGSLYHSVMSPDLRLSGRASFMQRGYGRWLDSGLLLGGYEANGAVVYPKVDWSANPDGYLETVRELAGAGFTVDTVAIPNCPPCRNGDDGIPDWEWMNRVLAPIYARPDYQALCGQSVLISIEPQWRSETWVQAAAWTRQQFPHATIGVHMQPDHSAPGWNDEDEAACWRAVAPYVNCCDFQSGAMGNLPQDPNTPDTPLQTFLFELFDLARRFDPNGGFPDWPKNITVRAREYGSYWVSHHAQPESLAQSWGHAVRNTPPFRLPSNGDLVDLSKYQISCLDGYGS